MTPTVQKRPSDSFQFDLSDSDGENVDDQTFNVGIRAIHDAPVIETNETLYLDEVCNSGHYHLVVKCIGCR